MNKIKEISFRLIKFPRYRLEEVFTPSKAAEINYVERFEIDAQLSSEMSTPGKQIIVFGDSGSGKTSSVRNLLTKDNLKFIKTHCESSTTFEQLILNAFDELNIFVVSGKSHKLSSTFKGDLAVEYKKIKASIGEEYASEDSKTYSRLLPPQLTPQKLAKFMGEGEIVWLIEDFHKVSPSEKIRIADVIKIFVDNANDYPISKIICIGACQSAHELIQLDPNLQTRVSEVSVPLLDDDEIKKIIINGFKFLNIVPSEELVAKLVYYSDNIGAFAHQMCMDICKGEGIETTSFKKHKIDESTFHYAIEGFIKRSADTFKSIYEAATQNELGWYILTTFSRNAKKELSLKEIHKRVNKGKGTFDTSIITKKLEELMGPSFNIVNYNSNSKKYSLSNPFWHRYLKVQFSIEMSEKQLNMKNKKNPRLQRSASDIKPKIKDDVDKSFYDLIIKLKNIESEMNNNHY